MNRRREWANEPERFVKYVMSWGLYGVCPCPTPIRDNLIVSFESYLHPHPTSKRDELTCLAWQYSPPPPHPHTRQSRCLVWKLSPPPNETISFVSLEPTVFQCNSGWEYSNKLRCQSCKGPLNATQHASSIHIYRESQNIIDIWSDKHGKWKQTTLSTLTQMDCQREQANEPGRFVKYMM